MSSLRNSLHRRNHKERSQLAHRSRLGILEKHKDYVLRARDYHSKQDRITRLRQKAADRNKDEFSFGMVNQRTEEGVHVQDRGNVAMPVDMVKILKTQDENYVRTMRTANMKKIDHIKSQLSAMADLLKSIRDDDDDDDDGLDEDEFKTLENAGMISRASAKSKGNARRNNAKHIVFVVNEEQKHNYKVPTKELDRELSQYDELHADDLGWKSDAVKGIKRKPLTKEIHDHDLEMEDGHEAKKRRIHLLKELSARLERDKQMRYAERELEMQKLLMGKGSSRKMKGVEEVKEGNDEGGKKGYRPRVYKWKAERKR